jgi:hypothetical protein
MYCLGIPTGHGKAKARTQARADQPQNTETFVEPTSPASTLLAFVLLPPIDCQLANLNALRHAVLPSGLKGQVILLVDAHIQQI